MSKESMIRKVKKLLKIMPHHLKWEEETKRKYPEQVFNAAEKNIKIIFFNNRNGLVDDIEDELYWVYAFECFILNEIEQFEKNKQLVADMIKKEKEFYHGLQNTIQNEDEIKAIFQSAFKDWSRPSWFKKWARTYGKCCEAKSDYNQVHEYMYNNAVYKRNGDLFIRMVYDSWFWFLDEYRKIITNENKKERVKK